MEKVDSFQIETTNPCGEQPLPKHGACGLCSINLSEYVEYPFTKWTDIDTLALEEDMFYIVEAMDNIVDENLPYHALQEQRDVATKFRNLGIGVMGVHDMLIKFGMKYSSMEGIEAVGHIMQGILKLTILASAKLASIKGAFPGYDEMMLKSQLFKSLHFDEEDFAFIKKHGLRNSTLLSIAPTGSIGTMLNVSTGIEPWYSMSYIRNTKSLNGKEESYEVVAPIAKQAIEHGYEAYLETSNDISWFGHVYMQAAAQKWVILLFLKQLICLKTLLLQK
jgi:ribonucleoside-diphosphate reductase alpha chain